MNQAVNHGLIVIYVSVNQFSKSVQAPTPLPPWNSSKPNTTLRSALSPKAIKQTSSPVSASMPSDGMKFDWEGKLGRIVHSPKIDKGTSPEHPNSPSVVPCPSLGPSNPAEHTPKPNINQLDNEIDNLLFPKGQSQSPPVIKLRPHGGDVCHGGVGDQNEKLDNLNATPKVKFLLFDDFITNEKWYYSVMTHFMTHKL